MPSTSLYNVIVLRSVLHHFIPLSVFCGVILVLMQHADKTVNRLSHQEKFQKDLPLVF